jgi:hypothetical protein
MFITSSGDPEKVGKASKALTAAIVGMVIVFAARLIIGFVIDLGEGNQGVCTPGVCKQEGTTLLLCMPDGTWAEVPHCPD